MWSNNLGNCSFSLMTIILVKEISVKNYNRKNRSSTDGVMKIGMSSLLPYN